MKIKKLIHKGYEEVIDANKEGKKIRQLFGRWHYIYEHKNKEVSLIKLINYFRNGVDWWEALQLRPKEEELGRFRTKKLAEEEIKRHFGIDDLSELIEDKVKKIKDERKTKNKGKDT